MKPIELDGETDNGKFIWRENGVEGSSSGNYSWALGLGLQWSSPTAMAPACLSNFGTLEVGDLMRGEVGNEEKEKAGRKEWRRKGKKGGKRVWTNYAMLTAEIKFCSPKLRSSCFLSPQVHGIRHLRGNLQSKYPSASSHTEPSSWGFSAKARGLSCHRLAQSFGNPSTEFPGLAPAICTHHRDGVGSKPQLSWTLLQPQPGVQQCLLSFLGSSTSKHLSPWV